MPAASVAQLSLWCLGAFLAGSVPFGLVLVKLAGKGDVRTHGSGNIGATNVSRVGGKALGIVTLLLDIAKGWLPVWLGGLAFSHSYGVSAVLALCAVSGHIFSPWLGFKGGKGVATTLGALLAVPGGWLATIPAVLVFALSLAITKYVSLGSILGALCIPVMAKMLFWYIKASPLALWGNEWNWIVWLVISAMVILKHQENIRRLLKGTESPLWGGRKETPDA